jgi:hypothetical protein
MTLPVIPEDGPRDALVDQSLPPGHTMRSPADDVSPGARKRDDPHPRHRGVAPGAHPRRDTGGGETQRGIALSDRDPSGAEA